MGCDSGPETSQGCGCALRCNVLGPKKTEISDQFAYLAMRDIPGVAFRCSRPLITCQEPARAPLLGVGSCRNLGVGFGGPSEPDGSQRIVLGPIMIMSMDSSIEAHGKTTWRRVTLLSSSTALALQRSTAGWSGKLLSLGLGRRR